MLWRVNATLWTATATMPHKNVLHRSCKGRVYRRPINKSIVEKIERAKEADWKEIGEIGDYFLYGKIKEEETGVAWKKKWI